MSKQHLVFIVNPRAGVERRKALEEAIDKKLDKKKFSYELQLTQYAKHGTELAKTAAEKGAYAVVAVGGDGSVNDIVAGLIGSNTALAIIPKGSGNGMARTVEIPLETEAAIDIINKGNSIMMDIGYANERPFISNAGVAFDALISKKFAKSVRRGFAVYSWLVTKHLWTYNEWEWHINIDGKELRERAFIVSVANGKQFGYNFQIAPDASWTDGIFDIIIIRRFPKIFAGLLLLRAMNGSITKSPYVRYYRGKDITIAHPELKLMQTDGDAHPCENKIHFTIKKGAQKVLVP